MANVTCGRCTKDAHEVVKHETVDFVRKCYAAENSYFTEEMIAQADIAQADAEAEAERRAERYWEERGNIDDGFDEWEARRGVLTYEAARDLAGC